MKKSKRLHERRQPTGNVYAALGREYERVGKLIDLSRGGLAFEYMYDRNDITEFSQINIFKVGEVFNLHNLPCKIVYDIPLLVMREGIESIKQSPSRRCGVTFKNLPKETRAQLDLFLDSHTKALK